AEFIGKTNLIDAVAEGADHAVRGSMTLRLAEANLRAGTSVVVSIRPHQIEISPDEPLSASGPNVFLGIVRRASYLGDAVDYQVEIEETGIVFRVAGPVPPKARTGQKVRLTFPPSACIPLTEDTSDATTLR